MRKIVFLISMLLVFSSFLYSQTAKYSNEFLSLGVGARTSSEKCIELILEWPAVIDLITKEEELLVFCY